MGELILGIIVDLLGHVLIELLDSLLVSWNWSSARHFAVWDARELVILDPEIGLENFDRGSKPEQGGIAFGQAVVVVAAAMDPCDCFWTGQERGTGREQSRACGHAAKKRSPGQRLSGRWFRGGWNGKGRGCSVRDKRGDGGLHFCFFQGWAKGIGNLRGVMLTPQRRPPVRPARGGG